MIGAQRETTGRAPGEADSHVLDFAPMDTSKNTLGFDMIADTDKLLAPVKRASVGAGLGVVRDGQSSKSSFGGVKAFVRI